MKGNEMIVRSLIALTDRQKDSLDLLARNICRKRKASHYNDKITASTFIRCLVEMFMQDWESLDIEDISTEEELLKRMNNHHK
jgi:hypothetical protein